MIFCSVNIFADQDKVGEFRLKWCLDKMLSCQSNGESLVHRDVALIAVICSAWLVVEP
jgi:hypothetical protein